MIYKIVDGKLKPYVSESGKRFNTKSKSQKHKDTQLSKEHHKFYFIYNSTKWKKLSRLIRIEQPLCRICLREYHEGKRPLEKVNISTSVDHIVPLKQDPSRAFDRSNLQGICHEHHRIKTQRESS